MIKTVCIFLSILLVPSLYGQQTGKLYPAYNNSRWGYINTRGQMVIAPQFYEAGTFSEGLAPVRYQGTYGYIDSSGKFVIPARYDMAFSFINGRAKVFIDGKPYLINKKGAIVFEHDFKSIASFGKNTFAVVTTKSGRYGLIDMEGELIADTLFKSIGTFNDGLAVVTGPGHKPYHDNYKKRVYEKGVIDTAGNWVIEYGRYRDIEDYCNGYARAELIYPRGGDKEWPDDDAIVDKNGKQRFVIPATRYTFENRSNEQFSEGLGIISIYSVDVKTKKVWSSAERTDYKGVIDKDGNILFSDPAWVKLTPYHNSRAFVSGTDGKWKMIDRKGHQVGQEYFEEILYDLYDGKPEDLFTNGMAIVRSNEGWIAIDTSGKHLTKPNDLSKFENCRFYRYGNKVFISEDISTQDKNYSYRYGYWNVLQDIIVAPAYHDITMQAAEEPLLYAMVDERMAYIGQDGKMVWQQADDNTTPDRLLNIDYMNRGYYYASSIYKKELAGAGGWGTSENHSFKAEPGILERAGGAMRIIIDTSEATTWYERYKGVKVYVVNASADTSFFEAQDSRLYIQMQAKDKNGEWRDIEYLPSSWCGNSYHKLFLAAGEYWSFSAPAYHGEFRTKIRAKLLYLKNGNGKENIALYSNEINGSVNPGQFWNKRGYSPQGIMDPYYD